MKRFEFVPDPDVPVVEQLAARLPLVVGRDVVGDEVRQLLEQGSVFRAKVRWRDAGPPRSTVPLEVFWPDLLVEEFTLDPQRIVWQDEHFLLVDKPGGVNTAPSPFSDRDCLTWGVQKWLGPGFPIHAVHRLDRDTSGLIFFAKHKRAELALHAMFRQRSLRKVYEALTPAWSGAGGLSPGQVFRWRDELEFRGVVKKAATTAVFRGWDERGRGLWTVLPHTGRPHQIRQHFARYVVPLWGDQAYAPGQYARTEPLGLDCVSYRFVHPFTGQRLHLTKSP